VLQLETFLRFTELYVVLSSSSSSKAYMKKKKKKEVERVTPVAKLKWIEKLILISTAAAEAEIDS